MSTHSNTFFNRIGIILYSILISGMSSVNRLRTHAAPGVSVSTATEIIANANDQESIDVSPQPVHTFRWTNVSQAFTAIVIWMVMGFAAGFLVGMIRPW